MSTRSDQAYYVARRALIKEGLKGYRDVLEKFGYLTKDDNLDSLTAELAQGKWKGKPLTEHPSEFQAILRPALNRVNGIATDIGDTIEEQENNGIGFLNGATWGQAFSGLGSFFNKKMEEKGFFAALFETVAAVFSLLFGGDAPELKQEITRSVATDMGESLKEKLKKHNLTEAESNRIVHMFENQVCEQNGAPPLHDMNAEPVPQTTMNAEGILPKHVVKQKMADQLGTMVLDGLEDKIIAQVARQKEQLILNPKPEPVNSRLKARLDELLKDRETAEGRAAILSFAAHMGGPNAAQREAMAREITDATTEVLLDERAKGKTARELAPLVAAAVEKKLEQKQHEIEKLDPAGRFTLSDRRGGRTIIQEAAAGAREQAEKISPPMQQLLTAAQLAVDHRHDADPSPGFTFNIQHVQDYAQRSMKPLIQREEVGDTIGAMAKKLVADKAHETIAREMRKEGHIPDEAMFEKAKRTGHIPNDRQQERIVDVTALAIKEVMTDDRIPESMKADKVRERVRRYLKDNKFQIDSRQDEHPLGLANNSKNLLWLDHGWIDGRYELKEQQIEGIANGAAEGISNMLRGQSEFRQLAALTTDMPIEAPRLPATPIQQTARAHPAR